MTSYPIRLAFAASLVIIVCFSGCGLNESKRVQQAWSVGGQYFSFVELDPGSAVIGGDWYAVALSKGPPTWHGIFRRYVTVCTLQGRGAIKIGWSGPRELTVTCSDCDRSRFYIDKREWKGVTVKYSFPSTPRSPHE